MDYLHCCSPCPAEQSTSKILCPLSKIDLEPLYASILNLISEACREAADSSSPGMQDAGLCLKPVKRNRGQGTYCKCQSWYHCSSLLTRGIWGWHQWKVSDLLCAFMNLDTVVSHLNHPTPKRKRKKKFHVSIETIFNTNMDERSQSSSAPAKASPSFPV